MWYEKGATGWSGIRDDDRGILWEHLVLDSLRFRYADDDIFYWQDKSHREIDFVVRKGSGQVDTFECKINPDKLNPASIQEFRKWYPNGENFIISALDNRRAISGVTAL